MNMEPSLPEDDEFEPDIEQVANNTSRKLLSLLAIGAVLLLLIHTTPFGQHVRNWDTLVDLFVADNTQAHVYFVLISSLLIMAGTPRLLFYTLGGFVFGFWEGLLLSLISSLIGSFIAFKAARWGGRAWLTQRFGKQRLFRRIVNAKPTVTSVLLMRMLPVSNAIINAGLSLSHVSNRVFLLGSLIGFLPQGVVAVMIGSGLDEDIAWSGMAPISITCGIVLVIFFWTSRQRRKQR